MQGGTDRYRGFFWPALLILAGAVALLVNTGRIPVDRLYLLLDLWPVILIVIGLELIVRRLLRGAASELAAALIVLLAVLGSIVYVAASPIPTSEGSMSASAPVGSLDHASAEVDAGAATIKMSGSDLGPDLYRALIEYSGPKPAVDFTASDASLRISQANSRFGFFGSRRFALTLQLNSAVRWTITDNTGASSETIDARNLRASSLSLNTGASREEISLGAPSGIVPVTINGGAMTVIVHRPTGVPASVAVSGGAVSLNGDGRQMRAVGDLTYESPGFAGAADGYRIRVNGGACTVTLDTAVSS